MKSRTCAVVCFLLLIFIPGGASLQSSDAVGGSAQGFVFAGVAYAAQSQFDQQSEEGVDLWDSIPLVELAEIVGECEGVPVIAVACAASGTGYVDFCVDVEGSVLGIIPVTGKACTKAGGSAAIAATGSLVSEVRETQAAAFGWPAPHQEKDQAECQNAGTNEPKNSYSICTWTYKTVQGDPEVDTDEGAEDGSHERVSYYVEQFPGETPAWHALSAGAAAWVVGDFDCIDGGASGSATADLWDAPTGNSLPDCPNRNNRDSGRNVQSGAQDTDIDVWVLDNPILDRNLDLNLKTKRSFTTLVSNLQPAEQLALRQGLKQRALNLFDQAASEALASVGTPTPGHELTHPTTVVGIMRAEYAQSIDEALATDFTISVTDTHDYAWT